MNVIGLGYIGLPTAIMLADKGISVTGSDIDNRVVDRLKNGIVGIEEQGIEILFESAVKSGIQFSSEIVDADCYIVAVPTPYDKKNKKLDPQHVINAIKSILAKCKRGSIIIIESTIAPGTIDKHIRPIITEFGLVDGKDVHLAHAPERIIPGNMISELVNNPRVIGADNRDIAKEIKDIYSLFCKSEIVITDIRTAEMVKIVENTYRDINIAFANELAKICRSDELNVYEIIEIANMHPRVNVLQPGPGVGGHCISVDPWFLVGDYPGLANIILAARKINDSMPEFVIERIAEIMEAHQINDVSRVGLYGLTYKEDVDDVRESPTLQLLENMKRHLATGVKIYDPKVNLDIVENQYQDFTKFLSDIDIIVIMVGHSHIKENLEKLSGKIIFDTRNIIFGEGVYKL